MSTTLARLLIGGFMIAHGLVHGLYLVQPPKENDPTWAFYLDRSWLLKRLHVDPSLWRRIGLVLCVATMAAFVLTGLSVFIGLAAWRVLAVIGAVIALVLFAIFWHRWLWIGTLLNAAIIVALVWASWPPASTIGE